MPYVQGESLRTRLNRETQLPVGDAIRIARDIAAGLDYAHRHGVIHRDIKPDNVLFHDGRALVADFGIALARSQGGGGDQTRMTRSGVSLGTPEYMSPEQAAGHQNLDQRTDVYALGVVLYEMLAGQPPFTAATAQAIFARVMSDEPRPLLSQRKTVPPHVDAAVSRALEKLPADRWESAAQFAEALTDAGASSWTRGRRRVLRCDGSHFRGRSLPPSCSRSVGPACGVAGRRPPPPRRVRRDSTSSSTPASNRATHRSCA
jgi:eukaryotic-like serine/threonine-protein kinase